MAERTLGVVLFPGFELLDVFGPLEAFGGLVGLFRVLLVAERAGPVASAQRVRAVADHGFADCPHLDLLLVPGGIGTREEVENPTLLDWLAALAAEAGIVTSLCTRAALLARGRLLDRLSSTTNKLLLQLGALPGTPVTRGSVACRVVV